jgi:nucleotide-binding universal stress UspA family protein
MQDEGGRVTPPEEEAMKLLVAIDRSEHSKAALSEVRRLVWPAGTTATLLSVVRTDAYVFGDFYAPAAQELEILFREERKQAEEFVRTEAGALGGNGLTVATRVEHGDPRLIICDLAKELAVDWVIVGSHGRRGFQKLVLGSVASHVVTHAPCSVLVVKKSPPAH